MQAKMPFRAQIDRPPSCRFQLHQHSHERYMPSERARENLTH